MSNKIISPKISALAITFNEEENVERYIKSLSFADEILFIDSFSTDNTANIAQKHGVRVIKREFTDFSDQRNFCISQAKNDWIIFFDLDEIITTELEHEIKTAISTSKENVAYFVKRNFHFLGKKLKYSGWQTDKVIRIFNKKHCSYNGNLVHEEISTKGKVAFLKNKVDHFSYKNFDNYNHKLNLYSKLQAKHLYKKNIRPTYYHFLIRPLYRFLYQYFIRLGFLDGKEGFIVCYLHAFSVFKRYLQLWMMYRKIE